MPLPKATDDEMLAALKKIGTEDEQIAFVYRLLSKSYRTVANEPWMQRWISLHASTINVMSKLGELSEQAQAEEDARLAVWERRSQAKWRRPFKWAIRVLRPLARPPRG